MKVAQLIELLRTCDHEAVAVVKDRTEFTRVGLVRPLAREEVVPIALGAVVDEFGSPLTVLWADCGLFDPAPEGPFPGLHLGPP